MSYPARGAVADEYDLVELFAGLAAEPVSIRSDYAAQLRSRMHEEAARQVARRARHPWLAALQVWFRLTRSGADSVAHPRSVGRHLAFAVALMLVLAVGAMLVTQLYPVGQGYQVATLSVRSGEVNITRDLRIVGDIALTRRFTVPTGGTLGLRTGDGLVSDHDGEAEVAFSDGSTVAVAPGAELVLQKLQARTTSQPLAIAMRLERGEVRSQVEHLRSDLDRFEISTPQLVAQVKGTIFRVDVRADGTRVATDKGVVQVNWDGRSVDVEAGRELQVLLVQAVPEVHVRPQSPQLTSDLPVATADTEDGGEQRFFTSRNTISWRVRASPGAQVLFYVNDALVSKSTADASGAVSVQFSPPTEGVYRVIAVMQTLAGEQSLPSPAQQIVVDRTPPSLVLTSPTEPQVSSAAVTLIGRTEPGNRLEINGKLVPVDKSGNFKQGMNLVAGANSLTLMATDRAGNNIRLQSVIVYEP